MGFKRGRKGKDAPTIIIKNVMEPYGTVFHERSVNRNGAS